MIQIDSKYLNDIKYNGNSIGRIMLDGDVYWGNEPVPVPPTPTHLIHGTTTATSSFNIRINVGYGSTPNVPVIVENGEFWLDELPANIGTITSLAGCFVNNVITSVDEFNIDTSNVTSWRAWLGSSSITQIGKFNLDLSSTTQFWDGFAWLDCETADLSGWQVVPTVTRMNGFFAGCSSLKHLDVSNWQMAPYSFILTQDWFYITGGIVDITMNNVNNNTFTNFTTALKNRGLTNVIIYKDNATYVYDGNTNSWVVE